MYLYELPTTGAISFSDFCIDQTIDKRHTGSIPAATQARANVRAVLKDSKRTEHGQKDYLQPVKLLEDYLPQLRGIIECLAHDEISLQSEPSFSWRTTLSANIFNTSPRLSIPGLQADLAFSLLTYAFALSNLARSTTISLGRYERDRAISELDRKAKDEQLNVAVDFLCRASGIFTYIADTVLPAWESEAKRAPMAFEKPPDLSREVNSALAKMALAEAQSLAIRKLLSKAAYESNIAPGPPLPRSHPSPSLIAKLHLECTSLYSSALSLVKSTGARKRPSSAPEASGEVSSELRRYLADQVVLHGALGRKWLGVDAGEKGGMQKAGDAVAYLAWAKKELEELKDSGRGINIARGGEKDMRDRLKEKVVDELESVNLFYKYYKKANNSTVASLSTNPDAGRFTSQSTCWCNGNCSKAAYTASSRFWSGFHCTCASSDR
ncbi:putative BRO1-like domain containing protein [Lyophyllum shimeji]|uniref:pH-response regulator protein palC n=1 Tax=Lyophyllum shimeji TaxID=47721 RepID=A0A9P3UNZ7_LYOSH|nr:putative BRO1-like domain containing protein [Lyophyllum shimeji]